MWPATLESSTTSAYRGSAGLAAGSMKPSTRPVPLGELVQGFEVVVGDVSAVGARVGREFELVQPLERGEGAGCGDAVHAGHVLLQSGQIVQVRRLLAGT